MAATHSILWQRLDTSGHDACHLSAEAGGWRLEGHAVFRHDNGAPAQLAYVVTCDRAWRSRRAHVRGRIGDQRIDVTIAHEDTGAWMLCDHPRAVIDLDPAIVDLDLGFTPATNLIALRRLALDVGQTADAPAAWLDVSAPALLALPQRYTRTGPTTYEYESSRDGYHGVLETTPDGFVTHYPTLWRRVA